jgi:bacillithiol biosynthesis cysteine-adding enzyme BshC
MAAKIDLSELPLMAEKRLYLDYLAWGGSAPQFFSHHPLDFSAALQARREYAYPRAELSDLLGDYNANLGATAATMDNIEALSGPETFCVIGGQQAGFLGGPVYTCYKIITAIRLARHFQSELGFRIVPVFWLASEDHDFDEINHAHYLKSDGEVGAVDFDWQSAGRPVAEMPITEEITRAFSTYFKKLAPQGQPAWLRDSFAPGAEERYCTWQARVWSQLFGEHGLVLLEPRTLRPAAGDFFRRVLEQDQQIEERLRDAAERLKEAGYKPTIEPGRAGKLYTFDSDGFRVRVEEPQTHLEKASRSPERYSTDVALRPLFADTVLPIVASVLGPGEIAYHAMLSSVYEHFSLPQPLYYPRRGHTVVTKGEAERLCDYQTGVSEILKDELDSDAVFQDLIPETEAMDRFDHARQQIEDAFEPLRSYVEDVDPNLGKAWKYGLSNALRGLENLEQGTVKARLSQLGYSRGELRRLSNVILPRERLQERVFPLPWFLHRHGRDFIDAIFSAGEIDDFSHHILVLEAADDDES